MDKISTSEYYIALLDLLGMKEIIVHDKNNENLNKIKNIYESWSRIGRPSPGSFFNNIKIKFFSDNVIIAIDATCDKAVDILLEFVANIAEHFLVCGYKPRGGVCKGDLYIDNTFVWGAGLVSAYLMENEEAFYPRIILSPEVAQSASKYLSETMITIDEDEKTYLNYLKAWGQNKQQKIEKIKKAKETLATEESKLDKVLKQQQWLSAFLDRELHYWESQK